MIRLQIDPTTFLGGLDYVALAVAWLKSVSVGIIAADARPSRLVTGFMGYLQCAFHIDFIGYF